MTKQIIGIVIIISAVVLISGCGKKQTVTVPAVPATSEVKNEAVKAPAQPQVPNLPSKQVETK